MATAELTVTANLAGLRAQLESIPGITADAATKMVAQLDKSNRAAERAAKQSAEATKKAMQDAEKSATKAAGAVSDVGDKFGKVGSSAGKLAGALGLVNPALGEAARTAADLADVGEVGAEALGALGTATAAAAAVVGVFAVGLSPVVDLIAQQAEEADRAAAALRNYQAATQSAAAAGSEYASTLSAVGDQIRLGLQLETSREQTARRTADTLKEQAAALVQNTTEEQRAAEQLLATNKATMASLELRFRSGDLTEEEATKYRELSASVQTANSEQTRRASIIATAESDAATYAETLVDLAQAEEQAERNARRKAAADRAAAEAARAAAEAERAKEAAARAYLTAVSGYADGIRELQAAQLAGASEEERILAAGEERIRQLEELTTKTKYLGLTSEQEAAAIAEGEKAIAAVRADTASKIDALEQDAYNARMERLDEERERRLATEAEMAAAQQQLIMQGVDLVSQTLDAAADNQADILSKLEAQLAAGEDTMTMAQKEALKERISSQREAAMQAFRVNKAAKLAEAVINTAAAVTQALASAPPPFNLVNAGLAGAAGGIQVAAIAASQPAFHSGGMVPDEVPARLVTGEAVLSRVGRSMIGDEQIRAANAGMAPPTKVVAINQYRHQVFRPFIRDHLRMGGDLTDTIRGTRTVGMREAL
jgi:hypothetical protein